MSSDAESEFPGAITGFIFSICLPNASLASRVVFRARPVLDDLADDEQVAFQLVRIGIDRAFDHDLFDLGPGGVALFAQRRQVDRHLTPAVNRVAEFQDFRFHDEAAPFLRFQIGAGQECHADRDRPGAGGVSGAADMVVEKFLRNFHHDAGAVAGHAVGVDRAPVPERLQRFDAGIHDLAARLAVDCRDQPDAAGIPAVDIQFGVVFQKRRVTFVAFDKPGTGAGRSRIILHVGHSAATAAPLAARASI